MANQDHVSILKQGVDTWNAWRGKEADLRPDLNGEDFSYEDLTGINFSGMDFSYDLFDSAMLVQADFSRANLWHTNFCDADLREASFNSANLSCAALYGASLQRADFENTDMSEITLKEANLESAKLTNVDLTRAIFTNAQGITLEQLSSVRTVHQPIDLDDRLLADLNVRFPHLLQKSQ